mmetsp:Transcript_8328/g.8492  ORF Transcript_8328/g.8492 Transcript_8328/m.8492 type:complete len:102 (-) Transcript_8328:77-382(-)|eukprot:CAMPEP_0182435484 /NCGR_PEP_ID=MMETSP1167-20130531/76006_1 /TAXON_ID=2988 /ORGANISM="Mallomonas Sp, Strain CCMP3275" /LENGTH=101 /DNA_ID=CAMNT_0024626583 /DNA_START=330 /DNA_END=635 /DNA_ORIENTATION=-
MILAPEPLLELWKVDVSEEVKILTQVLGVLGLGHGGLTLRAALSDSDLNVIGKINTFVIAGLGSVFGYAAYTGALKKSNTLIAHLALPPVLFLAHLFVFWQ